MLNTFCLVSFCGSVDLTKKKNTQSWLGPNDGKPQNFWRRTIRWTDVFEIQYTICLTRSSFCCCYVFQSKVWDARTYNRLPNIFNQLRGFGYCGAGWWHEEREREKERKRGNLQPANNNNNNNNYERSGIINSAAWLHTIYSFARSNLYEFKIWKH